MTRSKVFLSSVLAGICIGMGGTVFLMCENKIVGSALFTVGLFIICTFGLHLFTGKVCYVFENDRSYAFNLIIIWLGNLIGTGLTALCVGLSRNGDAVFQKASALCAIKVDDSLLSLFLLAIFCNICIYFAVEGYKNAPFELGKYLSLFLGVMVFILSGTEHCIADMFYFWAGRAWSVRAVVCILVITAGNCLGGVIFPLLRAVLKNGDAAK